MTASRPTRIGSIPSASGGIARMVYARLLEHGIPAAPLLSKAGLSVEQIDDRSARLRVRSQIRFLQLAAEALQDDLLGFHLARDYDLREIGLFYYVLASSEILNDALHKAPDTAVSRTKEFHSNSTPAGRLRSASTMSESNGGRTATRSNSGWCRWFACAAS